MHAALPKSTARPGCVALKPTSMGHKIAISNKIRLVSYAKRQIADIEDDHEDVITSFFKLDEDPDKELNESAVDLFLETLDVEPTTSTDPYHKLVMGEIRDALETRSLPLKMPRNDMNVWEARAYIEKRRRHQREQLEFDNRRRQVIRRGHASADWRTDIRCRDTAVPLEPEYREWTHKEIWDLITNGGRWADPRDVPLKEMDPLGKADYTFEGVADEFQEDNLPNGLPNHSGIVYWLQSIGKIIPEDDEDSIVDQEAEEALLNADFEDFDQQWPDFTSDDGYGEGKTL